MAHPQVPDTGRHPLTTPVKQTPAARNTKSAGPDRRIEALEQELAQAKVALKRVHNFADSIVYSLPHPLALLDPQLRIRQVNRSFSRMFEVETGSVLNRPLGELLKCNLGDPLPELLAKVATTGETLHNHEVECELPGGHRTRMLLDASVLRSEVLDAPIAGILVNMIDLSAIHHVQEVEDSLKQKETLLREIHHRVKNNLQVISSLLALQSLGIEDPKAQRRLKDSQERIRSMALIHEQLYKSRDLMRIDMREYVQSLAASLAHIYGVASGTITVAVKVDEVRLTIDTAIPCGLILNELLSNIYKYAFPDKRRGHVSIALGADGAGRLALTVEDNGAGLPPGLDVHQAGSLGLLIVRSLTEQLGGALEHEPGAGTKITVRFPEAQEKNAA